ncbi:MAG: prepilin peptidase [Cyanobacteria bacterium]|nr:prepilin peptidase [Cyanobacteria bacterium GSL.Bin21]
MSGRNQEDTITYKINGENTSNSPIANGRFVYFYRQQFVFIFGAAIGSFLNVVIYRIPANISLLYPPSRCPVCGHKLGKTENVPILGWLWLRGKCRHCQTPISPRYPLIEATTAFLFVMVYLQFGWSLTTVGYWTLLSWLLALSLIDFDTMTLPNPLTQSGLIVGLGYQVIHGWQNENLGTTIPQQLMLGIVGAVLGIWLFDIITWVASGILGQTAMGGGDAKLAAMLGAWLGWKLLLVGCFLACVVGAVMGGGAIALGVLSRRQPMPFGPFLALGGAIAIFYGESIITTYINLFFPTL